MPVSSVHPEPASWSPPPKPQRVVEPSQPRPDTVQHEPRRTFADTLELGSLENRGSRPLEPWPGSHSDEPQQASCSCEASERHRPPTDPHAPTLGEVLPTPQREEQIKLERVYRFELPYPRGTTLDIIA